jgi:hypothetical protein
VHANARQITPMHANTRQSTQEPMPVPKFISFVKTIFNYRMCESMTNTPFQVY